MATYKEVKGVTIQTRSEDPVIGGVAGATWASGNNTPYSGYYWGSAGTQTSNIIGGGYGASGIVATSAQYDGTNWTSAPDINDGREMVSGFGASNTAALIVAGDSPGFTGATEQWDGSSWTEKNDLNTVRVQGAAAGTSYTSGIFFGGRTPPNTPKVETEQWDGTSWTEVGDLNTAIRTSAGFGITTAAISAGGSTTVAGVESWNGSAWTELSGTLNTGRNAMGVSGTQTSGLVFGGSPPVTTKTEAWDGTTFTEVNDMANSLYARGGSPAGTQGAALASGGQPSSPSPTNLTEEFTAAPVTAAILTEGSIFLSAGTTLKGFGKAAGIPAGTWSSGGTLNTGRSLLGGAGNNTAGIVFGGYRPAYHAVTETYDGTTFTEVNDMNTARYNLGSASAGTQTSALGYGGSKSPSNTQTGETETWDGTSWTEVNDMNTGRNQISSIGVQTSALAAGGTTGPGYFDSNESWDGTSWTEVGDLNTVRYAFGASGVSNTSGLVFGGVPYTGSPPDGMPLTESWNGSSWTEVNDLNTGRAANAGAGTATQAICYAGNPSNPNNALTEVWNGTSWTEIADLATGRNGTSPSGSAVAGFAAGTEAAPTNTVTENFTAAAALSTITLS